MHFWIAGSFTAVIDIRCDIDVIHNGVYAFSTNNIGFELTQWCSRGNGSYRIG